MDDIINNRGRLQRGKERRDGFTKDKREVFLDVLAATGSVQAGARAAGVARSTPRRRYGTDLPFARRWDAALEQGYRRLEEELLAHAMGPAAREEERVAERDEPSPEHLPPFDPELAIRVLRLRDRRRPRSKATRPDAPSDPAEIEAALMRKLGDLGKRLRERGLLEGGDGQNGAEAVDASGDAGR